MNPEQEISAVGVLVPARNEAEALPLVLAHLLSALTRAPASVETHLLVIADRCHDATPAILEEAFEGREGCDWMRSESEMTIGALRHWGTLLLLDRLAAHAPRATWLMHTDADTLVPEDWCAAHLRYATQGAAAVAGLADLDRTDHLRPEAATGYSAHLGRRRHGTFHTHVYGANLGVRADAYMAAGGFPNRPSGEDVDLVRRLEASGCSVVHPIDVTVTTSARLTGRASGGLSALLSELNCQSY